jgi:hypothetical protein
MGENTMMMMQMQVGFHTEPIITQTEKICQENIHKDIV